MKWRIETPTMGIGKADQRSRYDSWLIASQLCGRLASIDWSLTLHWIVLTEPGIATISVGRLEPVMVAVFAKGFQAGNLCDITELAIQICIKDSHSTHCLVLIVNQISVIPDLDHLTSRKPRLCWFDDINVPDESIVLRKWYSEIDVYPSDSEMIEISDLLFRRFRNVTLMETSRRSSKDPWLEGRRVSFRESLPCRSFVFPPSHPTTGGEVVRFWTTTSFRGTFPSRLGLLTKT